MRTYPLFVPGISAFVLLMAAGCTTPTTEKPSPPEVLTTVERPYYSVISAHWKGVLSLSAATIRPGMPFQATLTLWNDSTEATLVPVDLVSFFPLGIESRNPGAAGGQHLLLWIHDPPAVEPMVRCRKLGPGQKVSFTREQVSPRYPGRYQLRTSWAAVAPVGFMVIGEPNRTADPAPEGAQPDSAIQ